jgi:hypothetical protein
LWRCSIQLGGIGLRPCAIYATCLGGIGLRTPCAICLGSIGLGPSGAIHLQLLL